MYRITKVINFRNLQLPVCIGAGPRSRLPKTAQGLWSPYDLWCVPWIFGPCLALSGFTKQAASVGNPPLSCVAYGTLTHLGSYAHVRFACAFLQNSTVPSTGRRRVIFTDTHVFTGVVNRAALTNDNVARLCELATEQFDAESLAFRPRPFFELPTPFLCHFSSVLKGYATISSTRTCVRY